MRASVRLSPTAHSQTRSTAQPSFLSFRETRISLLRLARTLARQNFTLLLEGRLHRGQPCQKQPSTKRATFNFGHAKSGFPATGHCFRKPMIWLLRKIVSIRRSVLLLPDEATEAIIFDRIFGVTLSIADRQLYRVAYLFRSSGWIESAGTS